MKNKRKLILPGIALLVLLALNFFTGNFSTGYDATIGIIGGADGPTQIFVTSGGDKTDAGGETELDEDGVYDSKDDVALYIATYGHLPSNYITKNEAEKEGWSGGSLEKYCPGKCIGGDRFGNREGLLPKASGRSYTECDIDTLGANSRGAKRIVFSNDGLIYYTDDHYESFTLLYGTP